MSVFRIKSLEEFSFHKPERYFVEDKPISTFFGKNVFTIEKMKAYLSCDALEALLSSMEKGVKINRIFADEIALGMKSWAVEMGATHYTHWFHPLTDSTAEKHEAFIDIDLNGKPFENFKGDTLIQQEPDASSFPSGGLRNTFEARGYTAWDPTSAAFILDQTLCIPSVFVSYNGEALDMKIPHLKSLRALEKSIIDLAPLFGEQVKSINVMLGIEQEYFVVDDAFVRARPDLQICNRTLIGHTAAKDQQLEDHYFGAIPQRVIAYMKDFETEAYKLGILLKTRHNEVAPNQFECAPLFCEANLASDQNLMLMILMRKIAKKHNLKVIFHEKPFMGVNGSGKHCNWSIVTDKGKNLLSPGKEPHTNYLFLAILSSVLKAVYKHHYLMMATTASLNNSYRLGGNEAPPAIMSVFLGSTLSRILDDIENANVVGNDIPNSVKLDIVARVPEILPDNTDRNRTSPFAFTGNRFEFRAVGSSVNVASSMFVLNTIVAQQISEFKNRVEKKMLTSINKENAILNTIREFIIESKDIRFEGNGYGADWIEESKKRGLKGLKNVPESYKSYIAPDTISLFEEQYVLSKKELEARYEVLNETYTKKLQIEARLLGDLIINHVIPTTIKFQNVLIDNVLGIKQLFGEDKSKELCSQEIKIIEKISSYVNELRKDVHSLIEERKKANIIEDFSLKSEIYTSNVLPYMEIIREKADKLEMLVDDELWPLPKYREMLLSR